ncbi:SRPBCC family protein [Arthrobacter sp. KK5.5]|uniref:SRPBCC family protein n=1 Tax=Arthrobacter sp. KK5.5 TaxID=3373084 RepID=UPI003EE45E2D
MAFVEEEISVDVPVNTAYNQWTQFESFPEFMGGVESVTQLDETTNHWVTKIGGVEREFDTRIVEQEPDRVVAWESVEGKGHAGVVRFEALGGGNDPYREPDAGTAPVAPAAELAPDLSTGLQPVPATAGTPETGANPAGEARERTRVSVRITWDDETVVEKVGQALHIDSMQVKSDLKNFKKFIESRGGETGGWRGHVDGSTFDGGPTRSV